MGNGGRRGAQLSGRRASGTGGTGAAKSATTTASKAKAPRPGSIAAIHATATAWQQEHHAPEVGGELGKASMLTHADRARILIPVVSAGEIHIGRDDRVDPERLARLYGENHLAAALYGYTGETIKEVAQATLGNQMPAKASRAELISRITAAVTHGHYSANPANFPKAAPAPKASATTPKPKAAAGTATKAKAGGTTNRPRKALIPVVGAGEVKIGRDDKASAYTVQRIYGNGQLRDALSGYTLATLKQMAGEVMARNPGTKPAKMTGKGPVTDYILQQLGAE